MAKPNTQEQGQVEQGNEEIVEIDPFAGDDAEPVEYVTVDVRRREAIAKARELLGDKADEATYADAVFALKDAEHPFVATMKASPRQQRRFKRDFAKTQPKPESKSSRISRQKDLTADLKSGRDLLSAIRTNTDAEDTKAQLGQLVELAEAMIAKIDADDES